MLLDLACLVLPACLLWAAASDLATMQIPNRISILLAAAFAPAAALAGHDMATLGLQLAFGAGALMVCAALFYFGVFGGGDAKLMAAVALWTGPAALAPFLFWTAVAGGGLAAVLIGLRRMRLAPAQPWAARLLTHGEGAPYAVAIAIGGLAAAAQMPVVAAALAG